MKTGKKLLSLLLGVILTFGMCAPAVITASALATSVFFGNLSAPLPTGTTKYFLAYCTSSDDWATHVRYLKVVKGDSSGELTVCEADSLADVVNADASADLMGSWTYNVMSYYGDEEWTIGPSYTSAYADVASCQDLSSTGWSVFDLSEPLENGTTRWFRVTVIDSNDVVSDKYLKVMKTGEYNLAVYEADSFADALSASNMSTNLTGACQSVYSSWNSYSEYWIFNVGTSYGAVCDLRELSSAGRDFANLSEALPVGATEYFTANISDGMVCAEKFLKVVKSGENALCVYEANTFADALSASVVSANLSGSAVLNYGAASWDEDTQEWNISYTETWTISVPSGAGYIAIDSLQSVFNDKVNVTISDGISVNFHLDFDDWARVCDGVDAATVTYKNFSGNTVTGTYQKSALPVENGRYVVSVQIAPAQLADEITVNVGGTEYTQSVFAYCSQLRQNNENAAYFPFLNALEQYWQAACSAFDYPVDLHVVGDTPAPVDDDFYTWSYKFGDSTGKIGSIAFLALTKPEFRFYTPQITENTAEECTVTASYKDGTPAGDLHARFAKNARNELLVEVTGVKPENFGRVVVVSIDGLAETTKRIEFTGNDFAKSMYDADNNADLGVALYNYGVAAAGLVADGIWE